MQVEPATGGLGDGLFVGRQHEIEQLEATFEEAASGRPRLAFLVGEPGIGKTATAQEFAQRVSGAGAMVLWGSCYEGEGAPPTGRGSKSSGAWSGISARRRSSRRSAPTPMG